MRRLAGALAALLALPGSGAAGPLAEGLGAPVPDAGVVPGLRGSAEPGGAALPSWRFPGDVDWPALRFHAPRPLDWRGAGALAVPVENPADAPFTLLLRLDDRADANGDDRSLTGTVAVPPRARVTVLLPLGGGGVPGLRGQPPTGLVPEPGDLLMTDVRGRIDPAHVLALHVSGTRAATDRTLRVGPPALRQGPAARPTGPLADAYGQALGASWPEKVANDDDLRRKLAEARADAAALLREAPAALAPDGGIGAPRLRGTGAFRTAKLGSRWALVTPAGRPFFSLGVDSVTPAVTTLVEGREALFAALPAPGTPLARFYGQDGGRRTFDVGGANLWRALGPGWRPRWDRTTLERLRAWHFNTLGNWSDPGLAPALPHVVFYDVEGDSAMIGMGDRSLADPFDPRFPAVADAVAAAMTAVHRDDAGLIGYFSGNELPWGEAGAPERGLAARVLETAGGFARAAFVAELRRRYGSVAALAAAWGVAAPAGGWDGPIPWPARPTAAALADRDRLEGLFAERYFATVAGAIRRHDPAHLYLGTRFAGWTPAAVRACARFCDVLSFNVYGTTPGPTARAAWAGLDKPVLIGEFHFGSADRGSFWPGMVAVESEAERGPAYAAYLAGAVADPQVVGAHWYQYADEALTGRPYDGENGHIGLVAVTDVPYGSFVRAVAAANALALADFARQVAGTR